jgi:hypothetical protein
MLRIALLALMPTVMGSVGSCGTPTKFTLNSAGFWPDPALRNENSTVSIDFTVPEGLEVTAGTVTYSTTYNFIPFSPTVEDICTQTTCPIIAGKYNQSSSSIFPDLTGSLTVKTEWADETGTPLLCFIVKTKVQRV